MSGLQVFCTLLLPWLVSSLGLQTLVDERGDALQISLPEVFVFLTTTALRAHNIPTVMASLASQTLKPSQITINIGDSGTMAAVSEQLKENQLGVHAELVPEIGPGTKYPTEAQINQVPANAFVLIVDDDWSYTPTLIEQMVRFMTRHPTVHAGGIFVRGEGDEAPGYSSECGNTALRYPLGYASNGLLFRKFALEGFHQFRRTMLNLEPQCKFVDDMYASGFLHIHGRKIAKVKLDPQTEASIDLGGRKDGALRTHHKRGCENTACQNAVLRSLKREWISVRSSHANNSRFTSGKRTTHAASAVHARLYPSVRARMRIKKFR